MAMKTLTEMDAVETEKRERAHKYEVLLDQQYRAKRNIERLEAMSMDPASLQKMLTLCADVPADLTTRGTRFIAGGFLVRDLLNSIVGNALADVTVKADAVKKALVKARKDLAEADAALKEFKN